MNVFMSPNKSGQRYSLYLCSFFPFFFETPTYGFLGYPSLLFLVTPILLNFLDLYQWDEDLKRMTLSVSMLFKLKIAENQKPTRLKNKGNLLIIWLETCLQARLVLRNRMTSSEFSPSSFVSHIYLSLCMTSFLCLCVCVFLNSK